MKQYSLLFAVSSFALTAISFGAVMPCNVLRPESAALAWRASVLGARTPALPLLRADVSAYAQSVVVDVLVAYDVSAQKWLVAHDRGTPSEYAQKKVNEMNECLVNSQIYEFEFRLVGTVCIEEDATQYRDIWGFVDLEAVLSNKLVDGWGDVVASGEWKKITDCREAVGADVVSVLVDAGQFGTIGLGYSLEDDAVNEFSHNLGLIPSFGDWAYSVCSISAADVGYSMLHEIGHNMGCGHPDLSCTSPVDMDPGPQLFSYSAGYYTWIGDEGYCTIMGYNFGGLRPDGSYNPADRFTELPYFSSPLLTYYGAPLGAVRNDNRQTLLATYAYVAQYREAKLPLGADPEVYGETNPLARVFPSEFRPLKAIKGETPYVGAVFDNGKPVAILSLKCGKASAGNDGEFTSKVSATVTGFDGKQKKSDTVLVTCGYDARATFTVKDWGDFSLTLGGEGFVGTLGYGPIVRTSAVGGAWTHTKSFVDVDFSNGTAALPTGVLHSLLPTGANAEPVRLNGGKWTFAKAAPIKYKKRKDRATKEVNYELQGFDDPVRTNLSAMKLTYVPKKGRFKGSFKIYVLDMAGTKPKLKKHSAKVSGIVVDGVGYGIAVVGKLGTFQVVVAP